jgi:hypothetical protein
MPGPRGLPAGQSLLAAGFRRHHFCLSSHPNRQTHTFGRLNTVRRTMRVAFLVTFIASGLLLGCATSSPFAGAERGPSYSIDEFEKALVAEKIKFLENELRNLKNPHAPDAGIVQLHPFLIRRFPTVSEWHEMKQKAKPGDRIFEFHHWLYAKVYDGPEEAQKRGYALIRGDRIIAFVYVDDLFSAHY